VKLDKSEGEAASPIAPRMATKDKVSIPSFEIKVTNNNTL
jgi:hypothetical protein